MNSKQKTVRIFFWKFTLVALSSLAILSLISLCLAIEKKMNELQQGNQKLGNGAPEIPLKKSFSSRLAYLLNRFGAVGFFFMVFGPFFASFCFICSFLKINCWACSKLIVGCPEGPMGNAIMQNKEKGKRSVNSP